MAEVLEPGDDAFDIPATLEATQVPTVLGPVLGETVAPVRRDRLAAKLPDLRISGIGVVGLVADDALGYLSREHEVEHLLNQVTFGRGDGGCIDRHGKYLRIDHNRSIHAFTDLLATDQIATEPDLAERGIDEALGEAIVPSLLHTLARAPHDGLEEAGFDPPPETPVNRDPGAVLTRQILPSGTAAENPEDSCHDLSEVGSWSPALVAGRDLREGLADPSELSTGKWQHAPLDRSQAGRGLGIGSCDRIVTTPGGSQKQDPAAPDARSLARRPCDPAFQLRFLTLGHLLSFGDVPHGVESIAKSPFCQAISETIYTE